MIIKIAAIFTRLTSWQAAFSKERPNRIDNIANDVELAAEKALENAGITGPPVNPIVIAESLGYSVNGSTFRDPNLSGRVQVRDGHTRIDINAREPFSRARFTVAHEIAHAVLHLAGSEDAEMRDFHRSKSNGPKPAKEIEADAFAAALLMPDKWVRERFATDSDAESLAQFFQVSLDAMKIRLRRLNLQKT
jgi:Zn-dependent peptidase ImmA (M78 family)